MSNAKSRVGALFLVVAGIIALLTMPVHRLWGILMLFLVSLAAGCIFLTVGLSEARARKSGKTHDDHEQAPTFG
ncbi:hypothetical protein [Micromonospora sp. WMMD975]|uniref:hypothetical protein n=1 Tax=Micromonospora sp. WMMD975 TaxID=3016087 RepID=UPI002499EF79|nr:hypothetical protein [Micromonospora sp. WMMD975]WFE31756.1 hypothetical protein O7613_19395 [Micromonospora sp. WMMD975]